MVHCSVQAADTSQNPFEERLASAFAGTVVFDVRCLNPKWPDCRNRDIDTQHVQKLRSFFDGGIDRTSDATRMKVTLLQEEWTGLLTHAIQSGKQPGPATEVNTPSTVVREPHHISRVNPEATLIATRDIPVRKEAGQHRHQALIEYNVNRDEAAASPEGKVKNLQPSSDQVSI